MRHLRLRPAHDRADTSIMPLALGCDHGPRIRRRSRRSRQSVKHLWKAGDALRDFLSSAAAMHTPCMNFSLGRGICARGSSVGLGAEPGAYAEFVRIGASSGYRLPDSVSFREGAMVEPLAVGLHAVDMAKYAARRHRSGDRRGAGRAWPTCCGRSSWARATSSSARKPRSRRKMAAKFGATDAIDPWPAADAAG